MRIDRDSAFSLVNLDDNLVDIRKAAETLFSGPDAPDGIVSGSGSGAVALIAALEARGYRLGETVDMVSKEPHVLLQWLRPEVMTMREDIRLAGRELAKAVIARIEGVKCGMKSTSCPDQLAQALKAAKANQ